MEGWTIFAGVIALVALLVGIWQATLAHQSRVEALALTEKQATDELRRSTASFHITLYPVKGGRSSFRLTNTSNVTAIKPTIRLMGRHDGQPALIWQAPTPAGSVSRPNETIDAPVPSYFPDPFRDFKSREHHQGMWDDSIKGIEIRYVDARGEERIGPCVLDMKKTWESRRRF